VKKLRAKRRVQVYQRRTYFESLRCVYVAEAAEFSVSGGSQSLHNLTQIYATSPNTWDWQVEAFCVDSIARSGFRLLTDESTLISRNARPIFSVRIRFRAFFPELRSDIRLASRNLHAEPGPRDHFQVALVGAAHGMISAINCTQDIRACVIASQILD